MYISFTPPQLRAVLTTQGWTDFKLQWHIQPKKQETKEKLTEPQCISDITDPATNIQNLQQVKVSLSFFLEEKRRR